MDNRYRWLYPALLTDAILSYALINSSYFTIFRNSNPFYRFTKVVMVIVNIGCDDLKKEDEFLILKTATNIFIDLLLYFK